MKKTKNKIVFKHQEDIFFHIGLIILIPFVLTLGILIEDGFDPGYVKMFLGCLMFMFIYTSFKVKEISLFDDNICISYPLNPVLSSRLFCLKDIDYFKFLEGARFDPSRLIIYLKNGKKKVYYFNSSRKDQGLINCLRQMKFEVKVKGDIWK